MTDEPLKKILIIEDEKDIADIIAITLNKKGYHTIVSYDGEDALSKINSDSYDLVILDLMLPKIDGRLIAEKLKENPSTAHLPVIVMTAHARLKELLESKKEFNVSAYLEKPFPISTLVEKVKEVLGA